MQGLAKWLENSWWVFVAIPLAALGLWLLYRALLADRAKGRRRCPKCWYDLQAAVVPVQCPECGHVTPHERLLHGTHRKWGVAIAALALLAAAPWTKRFPDAVRNGPARLVPTWALLQFCREEHVKQWTEETLLFGPKASSPFAQELVRRGVEEPIPMWQSEMFERRVRHYLVTKGEAVMPSGEEDILRTLDAAKLPSDRSIPEMEQLFDEVGNAMGTTVEVDWESMWQGKILKTDAVGFDTRSLSARVAIDRVLAAKPTPVWLKWTRIGDRLRCEKGLDPRPTEVRGFDVGLWIDAATRRDQHKCQLIATHRTNSPSPIRDSLRWTPLARDEILYRFAKVLVASVRPSDWVENGGESARHAWLGNRVLVSGPLPLHLEIRDFLSLLASPVRGAEEVHKVPSRNPIVYDLTPFLDALPPLQPDSKMHDDLQRVITSNVAPDTWANNGGEEGWILGFGSLMIVSQNAQNQLVVAGLLNDLRRNLPAFKRWNEAASTK